MSSHSEIERSIRYMYATVYIGKKIMGKVVNAYSEGKTTTTYHEDLLAYYALKPNNKTPERLYKGDFNAKERTMLENPTTRPEDMDVTLSEKLLRRLKLLTNLEDHNSNLWTKDDPPSSNTSIEYLIYCVKDHRNNACHEICGLSETELADKLYELEVLYTTLVEKVLTVKGKPNDFICAESDEIKMEFANIDTYIKEFINKVKDSCLFYLRQLYKDLYDINPVGFLDLDHQVAVEDVFTDMIIINEEKSLLKKGDTERRCDYRQMLDIKTMNNKTPRILTITAVGGNGKTTYTRLYICKWGKNLMTFPGLSEVDMLFFIELRNVTEDSFDDILRERLGNVLIDHDGLSLQKLRTIILTSKVLFILDGQDESRKDNLLKDILKITSYNCNVKVVITTRPSASVPLQKLLSGYNMPKLDLQLIGIAKEKQFTFIKNLVIALVSDPDEQDKILSLVDAELPSLNESLGEIMQSPLMLSLLAVLWISGNILQSITTTEIFMKVNELLRDKLEARVLHKLTSLTGFNFKENIDKFEEYLQETAFHTFLKYEMNFEESTIDLLKNMIKECNLTGCEMEVLEHYFALKKTRKCLKVVNQFAYKHSLMHEFDASKHACRVLSSSNERGKGIKNRIKESFSRIWRSAENKEKTSIMKQLQEERCSNIRTNIIAIFAETNPQMLSKYGKAIIDCEKTGQNEDEVDGLLRIVKESKTDSAVVEMISTRIEEMPQWTVKNPSGVTSLLAVLQRNHPTKLVLDFSSQTVLPTALASCLNTITEYNLELDIRLPSTPSSTPTEATYDDCLVALSHPDGLSRLTQFYGRLGGSEAVQQLPTTLERLIIAIGQDNLPTLMQRLPHLTQLQLLSLYMRCSDYECATELALLHVPPSLIMFAVFLYDVGNTDDVSCLLQLCWGMMATRGRRVLWLLDSHVSGDWLMTLLERLATYKIKVDVMRIRSSQSISAEQEQLIRLKCKGCIEDEIAWICGEDTLTLTPLAD